MKFLKCLKCLKYLKCFFVHDILLYKPKNLSGSMFLIMQFLYFSSRLLYKARANVKTTWLIILLIIHILLSLSMILNPKHRTENLKTKNQRYRNTRIQNKEKRKPSFTKRIRRKCNLYKTVMNKITTKRDKIQFRSSFNGREKEKF